MRPDRPNTVILQSNLENDAGWLCFSDPVEVISTVEISRVSECIERAEALTHKGFHTAGFVAYEAAGGFDPALKTLPARAGLPLVWFGVYRGAEAVSPPGEETTTDGQAGFRIGDWTPSLTESAYTESIQRIRRHIRDGDTYQVNYTFPMRASFSGDPWAFFVSLLASQHASYCAYLNIGDYAICSLSPELFLSLEGDRVVSRPMKGTTTRGLNRQQDQDRSASLYRSAKNRAENVMIVDMVRNDLGRVAEIGSVRVERLFEIERYPTVFQMTSTVSMKTSAGPARLLAEMFPCASITGAPKARTMELIGELETASRGIYTGAIGFMAPGRRAQFNVAIRTALIDSRSGVAEYPVGGGIVWDSEADNEYAECLSKAAVLNRRFPAFELLESLRWDRRDGYWLLGEHLERLKQSAEYFDYPVDIDVVEKRLQACASELDEASKVRLTVDRRGRVNISSERLDRLDGMAVGLAGRPCQTLTPFHCNKTTYRSIYSDVVPDDCGDAILFNEDGGVTESTFANLVLVNEGGLYTPPAYRGLLPGVMRRYLLARGVISEADIRIEDLTRESRLYLLNSVRGWMALEPLDDELCRWRLRELDDATAERPRDVAKAMCGK